MKTNYKEQEEESQREQSTRRTFNAYLPTIRGNKSPSVWSHVRRTQNGRTKKVYIPKSKRTTKSSTVVRSRGIISCDSGRRRSARGVPEGTNTHEPIHTQPSWKVVVDGIGNTVWRKI